MSSSRVVHYEIPANEPAALQRFYGELFGWKFQRVPVPGVEFWQCEGTDDGPGINVAVLKRQNAQQPWMNYIGVGSIDAALEKATGMGATVALPKMPVPGGRAIAAVIDPEGNMFGLMEQAAG